MTGLMVVRRKQMAVRKGTEGKHREERDGYLVSCERRRFLRKPLLPKNAKNGIVVAAQKRTCARDGDAAGAMQASRPCYKGCTGRQSQKRLEDIQQDLVRHVEVSIKITGITRQKFRNCGKNSSGARMQSRSRECSASLQVKKAGLKNTKRSRWMKKLTARAN